VKLLLDTHAAVNFIEDDPRLGIDAAAAIENPSNQVLLSAVVVWEVAIRRALGKLPVDQRYLALLLEAGVEPLAISVEHARAVEDLPAHHRDPFDRLLVVQAVAESATLVTNDEKIRRYDVSVLW
jgi:PIN domain nuclease of toxin-antitoxin system